MRVIKRYSNRRLYDNVDRRTITHERLKELVASGESFRIEENSSGRDVTVEILGRLMARESEGWTPSETAQTNLRNLIIEGGNVSMSILKNTVLASIGAFNLTKKKAEQLIDQLIASGDLTKSQKKEAVLELLEKADKSTEEFRLKVAKQADKIGAEVHRSIEKLRIARRDDVDALSKKFDKLMKSVARLEKKLAAAEKK